MQSVDLQAVIVALLIPFLGTALGSAFVFLMKNEIPPLRPFAGTLAALAETDAASVKPPQAALRGIGR